MSIFFRSILFTLKAAGAENIQHADSLITCEYAGQHYSLIYVPGTTCTDALRLLGLIRDPQIVDSDQKAA